ncbi:STAS domain-containing protein [Halodesulfurarchaeum sp. HSR-GB]|uniref:STAS domain-containing protein n=1 Tax=Halodesulfurarchaeum sp. HSR-GB TaxID=3074077 RepID=UPI00286101DC|nr:STAS domain-containing protein [Halodesulfurarchaeum sp. HSR-GB]MDR5657714.1 STAS domain-containing protein [Halodesulfurarchaeum sp. HSR-GB]
MLQNSANVVRIHDILLGTFPNNPKDEIIDELQETILEAMDTSQPEGVILDVSGVELMDSFFARHISETAQLIDLMGGTTVIAGMRPEVAITAAELGYGLGNVETARSTDQALEILGVNRDPE